MFVSDFQVSHGVLSIDSGNLIQEMQMHFMPQIAPGDVPHPDPITYPNVMIAPGDIPYPPDPK